MLSAALTLRQSALSAAVPALQQLMPPFRQHGGHALGGHDHDLADGFGHILETAPSKFQGEARKRLRVGCPDARQCNAHRSLCLMAQLCLPACLPVAPPRAQRNCLGRWP